jgi:hypothetical protein
MAQSTAQRATNEIEGLTRGDGPDIDLAATGGDFVVLPEDIYVVELLRFEEGPEGPYGPSVRLVYGVAEGEHAGETLDELASLKSGPKAKLRQRAEALRGRPYETGEAIRLVPLFGSRARAVVKVHRTDQGGEFNRIDNLMPLPAPRSTQRVLAVSEAPAGPPAVSPRRF